MRHLFITLLFCSFAFPAFAQRAVHLLADRIEVLGSDTLRASGNVEIWQGDRRLVASALEYDQKTGALRITGPLRLHQGDAIAIVADQASLDAGFRNGILKSARLVLQNQLQITSAEIQRIEGRYSQAFQVAATSCHICNGRPPIWQIRARKIVHDEETRLLHFTGAQFRIYDVPVFYVPYLRMPDPSLDRAAGMLVPEITSSSLLGLGIKLPFFIPIGDHADVTLTPNLSSDTRSLEFRYRQAFAAGDLEFNGAISDDTLLGNSARGYLFGGLKLALAGDFSLGVHIEASSDDAYLQDYQFSDQDRLKSFVALDRSLRNEDIGLSFATHKTLRAGISNATIPSIVLQSSYLRRGTPLLLGGHAQVELSFHGAYRYSDDPTDGPDADSEIDGFDIARLSAHADWGREWILPFGLEFGIDAALGYDGYVLRQHSLFGDQIDNSTASLGATLSWPLIRKTQNGAVDIVTPTIGVASTAGHSNAVPNQDSTRVEWDEGNLFSFNRSPGYDLTEDGTRVNLGLNWVRFNPSGTQTEFYIGRVLRRNSTTTFSTNSGLNGANSDWLISGRWLGPGLALLSRSILTDEFTVRKSETRLELTRERYEIGAKLIWISADPAEDQPDDLSELSLSGRYKITPFWTGSAGLRYDVADRRASQAKLGLSYLNECIEVDFSASRRFTTSQVLQASTDYRLTVGLRGFSTGASGGAPKRQCVK